MHVDRLVSWVKYVLANTCMSTDDKQHWVHKLEQLGESYTDMDRVLHKQTRIEHDTISVIETAFSAYNCKTQYKVQQYFIDLYIADLNVAVECDEQGHVHYCPKREDERTTAITKELSCRWVRYNPHDKGFNIGTVIRDILALGSH